MEYVFKENIRTGPDRMGSLGGIAGIVAAVEVTSAANGSLATHCQLVHAPSQCCQTKHPMSNAEGNAQLSPKEQTSLANAIRSKQIRAQAERNLQSLQVAVYCCCSITTLLRDTVDNPV